MDAGGLALASSALGIAALAAPFARFCASRPSHATASTSAATAAYNVFVFIDKTSFASVWLPASALFVYFVVPKSAAWAALLSTRFLQNIWEVCKQRTALV